MLLFRTIPISLELYKSMKMLQKSRENADVQKESIVNKYAFKRSIFSVCTYIHGIMRKKG